jgi:hypothetical protein
MGDDHAQVAAPLRGELQAVFQEGELGAVSSPLGERARACQDRDGVAQTDRGGRNRPVLFLWCARPSLAGLVS